MSIRSRAGCVNIGVSCRLPVRPVKENVRTWIDMVRAYDVQARISGSGIKEFAAFPKNIRLLQVPDYRHFET